MYYRLIKWEIKMFKLLFPIWLSGIMLAIVSGPIGSFIIWRRMSYFGDTLSHASLLGISIGLFFNINPFYTVIIITLLLSLVLLFLEEFSHLTTDSILGVIAHSTFSLGLVLISLMPNLKIDLMNYLFGDLLSVNFFDLINFFVLDIIVLTVLMYNWNKFLAITINIEMAQIDGIKIKSTKLILVSLIALVIGISMKLVGALLVTAMMIIPSAIARRFAYSPEHMIIISIIIGSISVTGGIILSFFFDTPTGPSVILISSILFLFSLIKKIEIN